MSARKTKTADQKLMQRFMAGRPLTPREAGRIVRLAAGHTKRAVKP